MRAVVWIVDILVGWIVGSIVVGGVLGIVTWTLTNDDAATTAASQTGAVIGTVLGIVFIRRRFRTRKPAASPVSAAPVAGWYSDPWEEAVHRFHDGTQWTAHVSGEGALGAGSAAAPTSLDDQRAQWAEPGVPLAPDDVALRLARLDRLLNDGAITSEEYAARRSEILREI